MDQTNNLQKMLGLIPGPAFSVCDGLISHCNRDAAACMLEPGTPVAPLLLTGQEEYSTLSDGCLYLQLKAADSTWGASVTRLDGSDLFRLESQDIPTEVKAMNLLCAELRYPIGTLSLLTERLLTQHASDTDAAAVIQELSRILRILNNVSNMERFLSDGASGMEAQNVCAVMEELLEECAALLEHADFKLQYSLPEKPVYSMVNTQALRQSMYNLLNNAAKYTPAGSTIRVSMTQAGSLLQISVADSGEGIPAQERSSIFSRFTRQPGIEDGRQDLGLGLALVRAAAMMHGGAVLVDAPNEGGTRVTMTLQIQDQPTGILRNGMNMKIVSSVDNGLVMLSNVLPKSLYVPTK